MKHPLLGRGVASPHAPARAPRGTATRPHSARLLIHAGAACIALALPSHATAQDPSPLPACTLEGVLTELATAWSDPAAAAPATAAVAAGRAAITPVATTVATEVENFGRSATQLAALASWSFDLARVPRITAELAAANGTATELAERLAHEHTAAAFEALFYDIEAIEGRIAALEAADGSVTELRSGLEALEARGEVGRIEALRAHQVALRVEAMRAVAEQERAARRSLLAQVAPATCPVGVPLVLERLRTRDAQPSTTLTAATPLGALRRAAALELQRAGYAGRATLGVGAGLALAVDADASTPGAVLRLELTPRGRGARARAEDSAAAVVAHIDTRLAVEAARADLAAHWTRAAGEVQRLAEQWEASLDTLSAELDPLLHLAMSAGELDRLDLIAAVEATLADRLAIVELMHSARTHALAARRALLGDAP